MGSEAVLERAMRAAIRAVRHPGAPVVVLGMAEDGGDREYGWILPSTVPPVGLRPVRSFVEKPSSEEVEDLTRRGALVDSFILAARGRTLVQLYEDCLPQLVRSFVPVVLEGRREGRLRDPYDETPKLDFSRAVLERCAGSLAVLAVPPCGWSDVGIPSRPERFLHRPRPFQSIPAPPYCLGEGGPRV